jgi:CubicO group peptidase (beta-lactamase class C family)
MINEEQLTPVLEEITRRWEIPGLAVGIVQDGEIVYAKGFGVQSLETRTPITLESTFCISSVSKNFVAAAVMQLAERGLIDLDAPIVRYLPYFVLDDGRYPQITIRQTLSHTSGMPDIDELEYNHLLENPEYDDGAIERFVRSLFNRRMVSNPGERFAYSNIGYNVLGDLIAKVSGMSFEDYMKNNVLVPAGMPSSTFLMEEVRLELLAVPHLRTPTMGVSPIYPYTRLDAPASFMHTNVIEMCHWIMTCLNGGRFNVQSILAPATVEEMWHPAVSWGSPPFYEDMGLGWVLGHYNGVKTASHGGMGMGWLDFLILMPEIKRGAVILGIAETFARSKIIRAVADTMLEQKPQVGAVSWIVPVSQAMAGGGIEAAYDCYERLISSAIQEYYFDEDDLINMVFQLTLAKKAELVEDVLKLNIHVFPDSINSYIMLAKIYLQDGKFSKAGECLERVLAIEPENADANSLIRKVHAGPPFQLR